MPSQTFFNLPLDKRNKLISCAMDEFSNIHYPAVSINKIIQNADISRGSFYMYFHDKEDLFLYLINLNTNKLNKIVKDNLIINNGNLEKSFIGIYDEIIEKLNHFKYIGFFKNVFMFFNLNGDHFDNPSHILYTEVENVIDFNQIRTENKKFIFDMFIHNLFASLAIAFKSRDLIKERNLYIQKINILCYGVYKKEEDVC